MAAVPSIGRAEGFERAAAPEADLTRTLYEGYAAQIFRYCLHQLGSREEAEDAVQSTFLNAFRGIKRGVVPEAESAWLFKIAHNVCLSRRRSTWRRDRVESPVDFEVVEELAPAPARRADELIGLQDVLERMPEQQRRAILLREWQGLSYREIGDELRLSQSAVETLIFRARRALAHGLEQPVEQRRKRLASFGNLLSLGSGLATKVAAVVAVAGAGTVVATAPLHRPLPHRPVLNRHVVHRPPLHRPAPAAPRHRVEPKHAEPAPAAAVPPAVHTAPVRVVATPRHVRRVSAPPAPAPAAPAVVAAAPATAPGPVTQGKSSDSGRASAPGQIKPAGSPAIGKGKATAPRPVKKHEALPAPTAPPAAAADADHGKATAPGQVKKEEAAAVAPAETPAEPPADRGNARAKP